MTGGTRLDTTELAQQLASDRDALREIAAGLDRIEAEVHWADENFGAKPRGYFTPDEDDRVRRLLLSYRGYRIGCYEILGHWRDHDAIEDEELALAAFVTGYAAALALYAKSLAMIRSFEREPLVRAKLNEPDPKFDLEEGFFEEMIAAYSLPSNLIALSRAHLHWMRHRRAIAALARARPAEYAWIVDLARRNQPRVRKQLTSILSSRLRHDTRGLLRTIRFPLKKLRWGLQEIVTDAVAHAAPGETGAHRIDSSVLESLAKDLLPGDILLVRAEGKLTTALLPGFWPHAAIYFGGREDLARLGVVDHPFVRRSSAEIPVDRGAYGHVLEAVCPKVAVHALDRCLAADHVAVLRPRIAAEDVADALAESFGHVGKPYDFEFDFNVTSRMVCTELVYRAFHGRGPPGERIEFGLVKRLGRFTLTPDDIVDHVLERRGLPLEPVALAIASGTGPARFLPRPAIRDGLARLRRGWRPARDPWPRGLEVRDG